MSFISILKKIGVTIAGVEHIAAPIISVVYPPFAQIDNLFQHLIGGIVTVEHNNPGDGQGGVKAAAVKADFIAGLQVTQDALTLAKKRLVYDDALLQQAIDNQVAALNSMAKLKASFKVVDIT